MENPELERLNKTPLNQGWKKWGPYLSERQWGTVREDYSANGDAWNFLPYEKAIHTAYRWGEDGIGGISDTKQRLCLAFAFWNGKDAFLKERLFGLSNPEGNHGEDVKELYYYLDSTPTHSYMKMLYKYPQMEFPYQVLRYENKRRGREEPEYELMDTGVFDHNRYFDIFLEYAKGSEEDVLIKITIHNRAKEKATLHCLPTLWFRNTWAWNYEGWDYKPNLRAVDGKFVYVENKEVGDRKLYFEGKTDLLFCENETRKSPAFVEETEAEKNYYKDGINEYVTQNNKKAVNPDKQGTKMALRYKLDFQGFETKTIRLRLSVSDFFEPFKDFDEIFDKRKTEADVFYDDLQENVKNEELKRIQRQAYAGMMWCKQYYYYHVNQWVKGDPKYPPVNPHRQYIRNNKWRHLYNSNVISMPDKWEYPWYAAWDLAFHCIPLAKIDPAFAKRQLILILREYYMHPNGQLPAYEWNFGDVNPPVHAWGAWRVYQIDKEKNSGKGDLEFLAMVFHKLTMNFTWWVNQKDGNQNNLFEGGFLGLDNIGVFDRSSTLPTGGFLEQADGTSWMAMYALNMMRIALELSVEKPYYQEMAAKFFEHFLAIAGALSNIGGGNGIGLWDDEDEFYYDVLHLADDRRVHLRVRSMVGLIPLFAVEILKPEMLARLPEFTQRLEWYLKNRPDWAALISRWYESGRKDTKMLSLARIHRLKCILKRLSDPNEFLSDYGIRALSKYHLKNPYRYRVENHEYTVQYIPGESDSGMFGGNSNWRGPIWFPVNYLLIESLYKFYAYYGDSEKFEFPVGSGNLLNLKEIAFELAKRLLRIFTTDSEGKKPFLGDNDKLNFDPNFSEHILFYEYFHGDSGKGLGASHQTGWTGLIADLIDRVGDF